jgi:hypothetical protein
VIGKGAGKLERERVGVVELQAVVELAGLESAAVPFLREAEVTVCWVASWLTQVTVSPTDTFSAAGKKVKASITTSASGWFLCEP